MEFNSGFKGLNKLYYESQYGITRVCGKAEHHDQMEVNAECVTNPSRVAEFLTGNKFPEDMLNLKLQHASHRVRINYRRNSLRMLEKLVNVTTRE